MREGVAIVEKIERMAQGFSGTLGVAAAPLAGAEERAPVFWNAQAVFPPASVIKVPIMVAVVRTLPLDMPLRVELEAHVTGSGILKDLSAGTYSVRDLLVLMIAISDNTATNVLIDAVGRDRINETAEALGLRNTWLSGKLQLPPEQWNADQRANRRSRTTPADMLSLLEQIYRGEAAEAAACKEMLSILHTQQYTHVLGRYLPYDPDAVEEGAAEVVIAGKSGAIRGVRNEIGIITAGPVTYAVSLFTQGCRDRRFYVDNEAERLLARLSRLLFDHFTDQTPCRAD
ncbi:MAG TPA: serine hydrolase [Limnochordia bacterium]